MTYDRGTDCKMPEYKDTDMSNYIRAAAQAQHQATREADIERVKAIENPYGDDFISKWHAFESWWHAFESCRRAVLKALGEKED